MWTTNYKRNDTGAIVEATHDFGNDVTVVTSFETNQSELRHGKITIGDPNEINPELHAYFKYLSNIDGEVNPIIKNEEDND